MGLLAQEAVGPYTIALAVLMLVGLPIATRYFTRSLKIHLGPLRAEMGEMAGDAKRAVVAAEVAATAAGVVGESVGESNGAGSIQEQLGELRQARVEDAAARVAGQHRQAQIAEACAATETMVTTMRQQLDSSDAWQAAHGAEDMRIFQELHAAVDHLRGLLGEPELGMTNQPLIPYMHDLRHSFDNARTVESMLTQTQSRVLSDAVATLKEMRQHLDGLTP